MNLKLIGELQRGFCAQELRNKHCSKPTINKIAYCGVMCILIDVLEMYSIAKGEIMICEYRFLQFATQIYHSLSLNSILYGLKTIFARNISVMCLHIHCGRDYVLWKSGLNCD